VTPPAHAPAGPWTLLVAVVPLLTGCLMLNERDATQAVVRDGGPDAPRPDVPFDVPPDHDGGVDGGDGGTCPGPGCFETDCTNGIDDDGDGLVDCADFDCASFPGCCTDGALELQASWDPESTISALWRAVPTGSPYPSRGSETAVDGGTGSTFLYGFEPHMPTGVLRRSCTPLALGARLRVTMAPQGAPGCTDTACDRFAAVVLTAAEDSLPGRRLLDDLAVTVQANGLVRVTQGGASLGSTRVELGPTGRAELGIEITPGVDHRGRPALFATVEVTDRMAGTGRVQLLDRTPFLLQRDLIDHVADCAKMPGLFVAVEGQGDRVRVEPLTVERLECANPSQFAEPDRDTATLTPYHLDLGDWASGGLGAPALASTCDVGETGCFVNEGPPGVRWDLLIEATNVDPGLARFTHVGWSMGHAMGLEWDAPTGWITDALGPPKAGHDPPTCLDGGDGPDACGGARSLRDPGLLPVTNELGQLTPTGFIVTYAREHEPAVQSGARDVFALHVQTMHADPYERFESSEGLKWTPTQAGCDSLRDPEIIPQSHEPGAGYFLLYTCERNGLPPEVHRIALTDLLVVVPGTRETVLSPSMLGAFAQGGVRAAEAVVVSDPQEVRPPLVRAWFVARDAAGRPSVGMAMGQGQTFGELPDLVPYPGNPVLWVDDVALGGPCGDDCELVGLDVVRRADDARSVDTPITLRFVVARRVDGHDYELAPLEQLWRALP
jgi:hypothetical protein